MNRSALTRRDLMKSAALGATGLAIGTTAHAQDDLEQGSLHALQTGSRQSMVGVRFQPKDEIRVGIIGVGGRGTGLLSDLLEVKGARVVAVCDIVRERVVRAQRMVMQKGQPEPSGYWRNERDYENLTKRDDLDLVIVATPWDWHTVMALSAMNNGHHVGVEVPSATTLRECWQLVDASERTRRHCIMLENCCYGYWEMAVFNMVHQGLLGTLTHGEAAYIHDLRGLLMAPDGEGLWRWKPHTTRDANLYPTHGLGPVCNYMDINRGDRLESIISFSSLEASLTEYRDANPPQEEAKKKAKFVCGDMSTALIRTALGRTIMLQHDVVTPRPYSRINHIQGTKGTFSDYPARLALDSVDGAHRWLNDKELQEQRAKFTHEFWKSEGEVARQAGGHGGMDYIMLWRLIQCMRKGLEPDIDVYDTAAWSAPTPLTEESMKKGGAPIKVPDFTRGRWKEKRTIFA